jgi:hypothetical protein
MAGSLIINLGADRQLLTEADSALRPYFFSAFLTYPAVAATGMLACAAGPQRAPPMLADDLIVIQESPLADIGAPAGSWRFPGCAAVELYIAQCYAAGTGERDAEPQG